MTTPTANAENPSTAFRKRTASKWTGRTAAGDGEHPPGSSDFDKGASIGPRVGNSIARLIPKSPFAETASNTRLHASLVPLFLS